MSALRIRRSSSLVDPDWDRFLIESELGQYQQSTCWSRYKETEGWITLRVTFFESERMVGGYQILWKESRFGRIAYLSKGPVLDLDHLGQLHWVLQQIQSDAEEYSFKALILQLPDRVPVEHFSLAQDSGLLPCFFMGVIDCTFVVDTKRSVDSIWSDFRKSSRRDYRRAIKAGFVGSWGGRSDVGKFFELMLGTCKRQGVLPHPATEAELLALWDGFLEVGGATRLRFVEFEGKVVCGSLLICFGRTVSFLKLGWSGEYSSLSPTSFLICEMIEWASKNGYEVFDFLSFDSELATAMSKGEPLVGDLMKRRDFYKSKFGGNVMHLPSAAIWIPSRFFRLVLMFLLKVPSFPKLLKKLAS